MIDKASSEAAPDPVVANDSSQLDIGTYNIFDAKGSLIDPVGIAWVQANDPTNPHGPSRTERFAFNKDYPEPGAYDSAGNQRTRATLVFELSGDEFTEANFKEKTGHLIGARIFVIARCDAL
jgi:hypothetical protein